MPPSESPWYADPAEIDRFLDGELSPPEHAQRAQDAERSPELAAQVAARRAFLGRLAAAGATARAGYAAGMPTGLEARVSGALDAGGRGRLPRVLTFAAAAVLLLAVGLATLLSDTDEVIAMPPEVLDARTALESTMSGTGGCPEDGSHSPTAFPTVQDGELTILGCEEPGDAPQQLRARLADGARETVIGLVAVPKDNRHRGPAIGKYVIGDVVAYEVLYGDTAYYLAVKKAEVERRGDCAACHNRSRDGQDNPHRIELRKIER